MSGGALRGEPAFSEQGMKTMKNVDFLHALHDLHGEDLRFWFTVRASPIGE